MIPEYRLIRPLIKLKNNSIIKKHCKKALMTLDYHKKYKTFYFMFNSNSNSQVFNSIISLMAHFNNIDLEPHFSQISDFNFLVAAWRPSFNFQLLYYKDYEAMSQALVKQALTNLDLRQWYQEAETIQQPILDFLTTSNMIPETIIAKIKILTHSSGKLFQTLSNNSNAIADNNDYHLGYYLMLFYLLQLETKQTIKFNDHTNWNIKSYINYPDLFTYKLTIVSKLNDILMALAKKNFNFYWRVINYNLNNSFDL